MKNLGKNKTELQSHQALRTLSANDKQGLNFQLNLGGTTKRTLRPKSLDNACFFDFWRLCEKGVQQTC